MKPARTSQRHFEATKLLVVGERVEHSTVGQLPERLAPGDLLVVNRSGTLPSSLRGVVLRTREPIEIRLAAFRGNHPGDLQSWTAVTFGEGDWRQATEARGPAPHLQVGDRLSFGSRLQAQVVAVDPSAPRLVDIRFASPELVRELFEQGRPIQYSYLREDLHVWDQQTIFAGPPISVEPPSAGFPFNWNLLQALRARGVRIATLLHGAGLSSTGDPKLDARLPLAEYFEVPASTLEAARDARLRGHRVIALGTTVARALESAFALDRPRGYTDLKLGAQTRLRITTSLVTGMHEEGTSHAELMRAFRGTELLRQADREAKERGYRAHEYGDLAFLDGKQKEESVGTLSSRRIVGG